ncbi:MAG: PorV/PorQ family protein [Ignavibacteriaceae bacterium]|nr:PorV/PorQ family protein [Ignavibacteriaceae bacterium]
MRILLITLLFFTTAICQTAGNTGLSFLKFGFGARNIAMADAGTAGANDISALYYNPAKLYKTDGNEILFMHNEWIQDVRSEMLGVKSSIFGQPFALGINVTNISDIEIRNKPGEAESTFDANYFSASISTAFGLTESISAGISVKYLYEGLFTDESNGFGIDFGLEYETPIQNLALSAVIKNLGSMNKLRDEETKLPSEFRIGGEYALRLSDSKFEIISAVEIQKYFDTDDFHLNMGAEVFYNRLIALRAGYQTGYDARGFTAGVGLCWGNLRFDYAFLPFSLGLGSANLFSVQLKF